MAGSVEHKKVSYVADQRQNPPLPGWWITIPLALAATGLFLTAPTADDFFWSDAPRHALNGAFVADMLRERPFDDSVAWAMQYYVRYPALTILFYPPFFYFVEAIFFLVFGVSHISAQIAESVFIFLLGLAAFGFGRLMMGRIAALGLAFMLIGAPEMAFWSRQVMLDIPAYALGLAGMLCLGLWLQRNRPIFIYLTAAGLLAAIYTKYTAGFLLGPAALAVWCARGPGVIRDRNLLLTLLFSAIAAFPCAFLLIHFGDANFGSIAGRAGDLDRASRQAWLFYAEQIPSQLGYAIPTIALAGLGIAMSRSMKQRMAPWLWVMLVSWFIVGYSFFSLISVREPRHDIVVLFPIVLMAALTLDTVGARIRLGEMPLLMAGLCVYGYSLIYATPPVVSGYKEIASYVVEKAPPHGVLLYSGYRDGNFVFAMRELAYRKDLTLVRADKLLLKVAVERTRGVTEKGLDEAGVLSLIQGLGVSMVVAQAGFWGDIPQVDRLYHVLEGPAFKRERSFPITGAVATDDGRNADGSGSVDILIPTYHVEGHEKQITYDLPIIGHMVTGRLDVN